MYKTVFLHTIWQFIARSFTTIANFICILLIAQSLGSRGVGEYNKVFAFIGIFSLFVDFGINAIFLKFENNKEHISSLLTLRLTIAAIIFLLIQPIIQILPYNAHLQQGFSGEEKLYIEIVALVLFLYAFSHSVNAIFQQKRRFELQVWANVTLAIGILLGGIIGFVTKDLAFYFLGTILGWIGYIVVSYSLLEKVVGIQFRSNLLPSKEVMRSLFKMSLPLGATLFLNVLYVRADTLLLAFMKSTQDVGIYTLAYKFFEFPLTISFFIMNALYPLFLKTKGRQAFDALIKKWIIVTIGLSALVIGISYIGAPLLQFIKPDFAHSIEPFRILILSYPIFFLSNLFLWIVITENKEKKLPIIYISSLVLNFVLNIVFIPQYGYIASAWITVLSEAIVLVMLWYFHKKSNSKTKKGESEVLNNLSDSIGELGV